MTAETERILAAAMKLPDEERAQLAAMLADSIGDGTTDEEIEAAWLTEAKRRLEDLRSGRSKPVSFDEVSQKLRAMLDRARERQETSAG